MWSVDVCGKIFLSPYIGNDHIPCHSTDRIAARVIRFTLSACGQRKGFAVSNYELFLFDYGVARAMGMDHWDSLWAGLAWVGRK